MCRVEEDLVSLSRYFMASAAMRSCAMHSLSFFAFCAACAAA
jgi:hypothetical protein